MTLVSLVQGAVVAYSALLGGFLLSESRRQRLSNRLLGSFLFLLALDQALTLLTGPRLRSPFPTWLLAPAYGPLFYLFVRALVYEPPHLRRSDWVHVVPYLPLVLLYAGLQRQAFLPLALGWAILGLVVYLGLTYRLLGHYQAVHSQTQGTGGPRLRWVRRGIFGLGLVVGVDALDLLRGEAFPWAGPALFLGDMGLILALVTGLALEALHHPEQFRGIDADQEGLWASLKTSEPPVVPDPGPEPVASLPSMPSEPSPLSTDPGERERLLAFMASHRPYLEPNLTLQDLAKALRMSPKVLSRVINAELGRNFSEFINGYRIRAAKTYLDDPAQDHLPILDILFRVGFNAKSTFNWMFKRETGMTPSEYRALRGPGPRDVQDSSQA